MNVALFSWEQTPPSYQHGSREAYAAFLREYLGEGDALSSYLNTREQFVQAYPNLRMWFEAPLTERIGRVYGEDDQTLHLVHRVSYLGRAYLYYLVLNASKQILRTPRCMCGLTAFIARFGHVSRQCLNLAGICIRKQVDAVHLSIQSFPFSVPVSMECRFSGRGAPCR